MKVKDCPKCHKDKLSFVDPQGARPYPTWGSPMRWCPRCHEWVESVQRPVETHARRGKAPRVRLR